MQCHGDAATARVELRRWAPPRDAYPLLPDTVSSASAVGRGAARNPRQSSPVLLQFDEPGNDFESEQDDRAPEGPEQPLLLAAVVAYGCAVVKREIAQHRCGLRLRVGINVVHDEPGRRQREMEFPGQEHKEAE